MEAALWSLAGMVVGGVVTFLTSRHFAIRATQEALGLKEGVQAGLRQTQGLALISVIFAVMSKLTPQQTTEVMEAFKIEAKAMEDEASGGESPPPE